MCLIVCAYQSHPRYPLILAANRDEFYDRPTRAAQFWESHPAVLAGKDLQGGGTWMGLNRSGHFAALTNYRDPSISKDDPPSRGRIVLDYLAGTRSEPRLYLQQLQPRGSAFMGFNVLAGTPEALYYSSNIENKVREVAPGIHGLSNHLLDTPWPKVQHAKDDLQSLLQADTMRRDALFDLLLRDEPAPDDALPDTGVPHELEKKISPAFIRMEGYGTRCSTVLTISGEGEMHFTERRFEHGSQNVAAEADYKIMI